MWKRKESPIPLGRYHERKSRKWGKLWEQRKSDRTTAPGEGGTQFACVKETSPEKEQRARQRRKFLPRNRTLTVGGQPLWTARGKRGTDNPHFRESLIVAEQRFPEKEGSPMRKRGFSFSRKSHQGIERGKTRCKLPPPRKEGRTKLVRK